MRKELKHTNTNKGRIDQRKYKMSEINQSSENNKSFSTVQFGSVVQ